MGQTVPLISKFLTSGSLPWPRRSGGFARHEHVRGEELDDPVDFLLDFQPIP
jgi:hypothetical protein